MISREKLEEVIRLAHIAVPETELPRLEADLNRILGWIEQLAEVNVEGIEPLDLANRTPMRADVVTEGRQTDKILANAPDRAGDYFVVPKIIE